VLSAPSVVAGCGGGSAAEYHIHPRRQHHLRHHYNSHRSGLNHCRSGFGNNQYRRSCQATGGTLRTRGPPNKLLWRYLEWRWPRRDVSGTPEKQATVHSSHHRDRRKGGRGDCMVEFGRPRTLSFNTATALPVRIGLFRFRRHPLNANGMAWHPTRLFGAGSVQSCRRTWIHQREHVAGIITGNKPRSPGSYSSRPGDGLALRRRFKISADFHF